MMLNVPLPMWIENQMRSLRGAEPSQGKLAGPFLTEKNNLLVDAAKTIGKIQGKVVK